MNPRRPISRTSNLLVAVVLACGLWACGKGDSGKRSEAAPQAAPLTTPEPAKAPPPADPAIPPPMGKYPKPGWSKHVVDDQGPLCVFAGFADQELTKFAADAKKQTLRANASVVIGSFAGWCVSEKCDDLPSLQCSVKREGDTLLVHTHYWGYRKDGSACPNEICRPVSAGCETPPLEPGKYTIQHGEKSYPLKIPSVLRDPCFGVE
jgi:hypothetical protein